jgi:hypothetical protein
VSLARLATTGVAFLPLALASGAARADDDIAALRGRLDQIKELVAEFETRLNALEAARSSAALSPPQTGATAVAATEPAAASKPAPIAPPPSATPPAAAEAPVVVPRAQWRRVQTGLTMDEVTALIGTPTKTFELAGKRVWYYYYPGIGAGSVFFDANARASSFQRPAGGN